MATQRIPLVGSLINRNADPSSFLTKDQFFTNCYPEIVKNPITGTGRVYLYKRLGFTGASVSGVAKGSYGCVVWTGKADNTSPILLSFQKTGGTSTQVFNQTTQVGGDIANTDTCVSLSETVISTTSNLAGIFVDSGTQLFEAWFFPEGGAWTQITDGDFPPNLGTPEPLAYWSAPAHMDGYMFVMTRNGKIWNSDLNSLSAWTANSYLTMQSYPDGGVGVARYRNLLVGFGTRSIEFFQNTGNATGSPLTVIPSATRRVGAYALPGNQITILTVGDNVYWIGVNADSGRKGIYRLNGYDPQKISSPYIDKILNDAASFGQIITIYGSFQMHGMGHVAFGAGAGTSLMYCYCIDADFWWIYDSPTTKAPTAIASTVTNTADAVTKFNINGSTKTFTGAGTTFTDDGAAYTQTVQTEPIDMGTLKSKTWDRLRIVGDTQASGTLSISWSDDDFANFSTPVTIDLTSWDAMGDGITGLGASRRRIWKITHSANTPNRLTDIELDYTVGPN